MKEWIFYKFEIQIRKSVVKNKRFIVKKIGLKKMYGWTISTKFVRLSTTMRPLRFEYLFT